MDDRDFLRKASKGGQLDIVAPSENVCESYLQKADNCLKSAEILLSSGLYENSATEAYYAIYGSLTALLRKVGIKSENHAVSIAALGTVFGEPRLRKLAGEAREKRLDFQYYVDHAATKEAASAMLSKAENFVSAVRSISRRLTSEQTEGLREKIRGMLSG